MTVEVHIDWAGETHLVGRIYTAQHSPAVSFEYAPEWLLRTDAFAIDPTSLPLRPGPHHSPTLFGAMQDCGPDRWGRMLIGRAVRKQVIDRRPYQDLDYVLALDDSSRIGALRFRSDANGPFLATSDGKIRQSFNSPLCSMQQTPFMARLKVPKTSGISSGKAHHSVEPDQSPQSPFPMGDSASSFALRPPRLMPTPRLSITLLLEETEHLL